MCISKQSEVLKNSHNGLMQEDNKALSMCNSYKPMVEIPYVDILDLVRESERLHIVRKMLADNKYVSCDDLRTMLNVNIRWED